MFDKMSERGPQTATLVGIGGGKGGVGKSICSVALSMRAAQLGYRTVLLDGDTGMANLHTLLSIHSPARTLELFVRRKVEDLESLLLPLPFTQNLSLLPGSSAWSKAGGFNHGQKQRLIRKIKQLDTDIVFIDLGAGIHHLTLDLWNACDHKIAVCNEEMTSLQNAYGFVKAGTYRTLLQSCEDREEKKLFEALTQNKNAEKVGALIEQISYLQPKLAEQLEHTVKHQSTFVMGNRIARRPSSERVFALSRMMNDFLCLNTQVLPNLPEIDFERESISSVFLNKSKIHSILDPIIQNLTKDAKPTEIAPQPNHEWYGFESALHHRTRIEERKPVQLSATIIASSHQGSAQVVDLSQAGAAIETQIKLEVGERVIFRLSQEGKTVNQRAIVRNSPSLNRFGIQFESTDEIKSKGIDLATV